MIPVLDDLLNDGRLARLFASDARYCALQLWILQIKSELSIENRVVYGRLLPYSHSSDRWYSSDDDNFHTFGQVQAQVIRLNLYVTSVHCADLLRQLSAGRTISAISEELKLGLSDQLKARFGATALAADELVYRPVAYLLNRDAYDLRSPSSPHGGAGAFSASITQTDKGALFRLGRDYEVALTEAVVKHLSADTGLDFGGADTARFGDLELMVFPALDDLDRSLLSVSWTDAPLALVARFNPMQVPHFSGFQFRLNIENDGQIVYSGVATAERDEKDEFECKFELTDQLRARTDSTELEIFGFPGDHCREGTLCCRWRIGYVREVHLQGHVVGHGASPVTFDWLEKATRPSMSARVKAALTINRGNPGFTNRIGGRETDPWVPANRVSHPFLRGSIRRNRRRGSSCAGARATARGGYSSWSGSGHCWPTTNNTRWSFSIPISIPPAWVWCCSVRHGRPATSFSRPSPSHPVKAKLRWANPTSPPRAGLTISWRAVRTTATY
jgi:hypothetical protein